ncbi:hypothetical protein GOP47_0001746 [Adiantum capillus-veneris]|uniref:Uncharacterized protein n=1 Tax=Adiantum capillus-veneris TaxID=13818 RepID=A0A9D4V9A2_ADICA|nr:hypothetical protein GOP47_0001746 [Adiantum capillus-veneris]
MGRGVPQRKWANMAGDAEGCGMSKRERKKKKKKKKRREHEIDAAAGSMEMKQLVVQCSVPAHDAASFPVLAVARRLIHSHTSSPFPQSCPHLQYLVQQCQCASVGSGPFSPSPPPLIINHTCPSSPITLQQQVLLRDATPSPTRSATSALHPLSHLEKQTCHPVESAHLNTDSTRYRFSSPSFVDQSQQNVPPSAELPASTLKALETRTCKHSRRSIRSSLLAAAEDGTALASELLRHLNESLYSILPQSLKSKVSNDWDSMLSSSLLEQYMDKMQGGFGKSSWLTDPSSFKRVIKKVSKSAPADDHAGNGCHGIEDLLCTIESFERAGLIGELENLGLVEEACILRDRSVFYGLLARLRTLQEVSSLLCFMRLEMHLPFQDTWSLACSNARYRGCLKQIRDKCNFHDKIRTFAWKLDKLELCAIETDSCKEIQEQGASSLRNRLVKLIESPLGPELEGIRIVSYLDTAVSLLLHHMDVFESLQEHGFGDA